MLEERDDTGTPAVLYVIGQERISQTRAEGTFTYHGDGLGSIRALSDTTGVQTETFTYEAFGQLEHRQGTTPNSFRYTGEQYDPNLGFYYLRARYYDPATGRFPTMDTYQGRVHEPQTLHKYLYVHADPVNHTDPTGNFGVGNFSVASAVRGILSTMARVTRSAFSFLRAGRVNGVRVEASLQARIQLQRIVGQVQSRIPKSLGKGKPSNKGNGWKWNSKKHDVRVQKGDPRSSYAAQRRDYVKIVADGKVIGRNGEVLANAKGPRAHIPLSEWRTWTTWRSPF